MDDIRFKYFNPIISTPRADKVHIAPNTKESDHSFGDVLQNQIDKSNSVNFSKHATQRVIERNIDLSSDSMNRLNKGIRIASDKNINDALILVDKTAFVVNIPTNTVITTKDNDDLNGNVFTNINGTVII